MSATDSSRATGGNNGDSAFEADSSGGVTTVTASSSYPAASPFADDSADSPYGSTSRSSTWTGSPYEPLPTESSGEGYPSTYGVGDASTPTYVPAPAESTATDSRPSGRQIKSRAVAGLVSAVLGTLMVAGGLYLIGEFGFRIFDVMLNAGGQPQPWDIVWTSTGAGLIFIAVLLNGWSPWATLIPGLALTAAGIWSIAWYDGADRVASFVDQVFARHEMVVWGITGWMLVLGLILLGASGAVIIARASGRRRPLA